MASVACEMQGESLGSLRDGAPRADRADRDTISWSPGGRFVMGSNKFYREERPARGATVAGFWIDPHPVTNAEYREFVRATGYGTTSERMPDPALYPDAAPEFLVPGSLVFTQP